jgi:predicted signal transduction protein with EAL and GGDEF domain
VKVLFVGEGTHDIGPTEFGTPTHEGRPARGVVPRLAARVVERIDLASSRALGWNQIPLLSRDRERGLDRKVKAAALIASRRMGCAALVCVHDRDGVRNKYRLDDMVRAADEETSLPVVCGLAVESIEAWTLGACEALAEELGVDVARLRKHYDPAQTETFLPNSGKVEKQSKGLLDRVAAEGHQDPGLALREAVAGRTNVEELAKRCPEGFGAFRAQLQKKLA